MVDLRPLALHRPALEIPTNEIAKMISQAKIRAFRKVFGKPINERPDPIILEDDGIPF